MPTGKYERTDERLKNLRIKLKSGEHRKKTSKITTELYKVRPEIKEKISQSVKKRYTDDPTYRKRVSEGTKRAMAKPEVKQRYNKAMEKRRKEQKTPEYRKKQSEHFKKVWENQKCRKKMLNSIHNRVITEERNLKISKSISEKWKEEAYREKQIKSRKKMWENKEYQELMNKRRHARPNFFEKSFHGEFSCLNYVGDYSFFVGRKNPDFIVENTKKCIDLFGNSFHKKSEEEIRKKYFSERGYELLIIWESEWRYARQEIIEKTNTFIMARKENSNLPNNVQK